MKKRTMMLLAILCCVLLLGSLFGGLRVLEHPVQAAETESKTLIRDGVRYFPRQDINVVMVLGIDQYGPMVSSNASRNPGAADTVMLLIFDETEQVSRVLTLNRDTMVDMDVLGDKGEVAGTEYGQLALAYSYGTGLQDSCANVKNTLEKYLKGLTVDHYLAMNMDALPIVNDAVGGVTVTVREDFSQLDSEIPMGEHTLRGQETITFVQPRNTQDGRNAETRLERQQEYVIAFLDAMARENKANAGFLRQLLEEAGPYLLTDCSAVTLQDMLERYADYPLAEVLTLPGESTLEAGEYRFQADPEALDETVLELFYAPKN